MNKDVAIFMCTISASPYIKNSMNDDMKLLISFDFMVKNYKMIKTMVGKF